MTRKRPEYKTFLLSWSGFIGLQEVANGRCLAVGPTIHPALGEMSQILLFRRFSTFRWS